MSLKAILGTFGIHLDELNEVWEPDPAVQLRNDEDRLRRTLHNRYTRLIRCRRRIERLQDWLVQTQRQAVSGSRTRKLRQSKLARLQARYQDLLAEVALRTCPVSTGPHTRRCGAAF